MTEAPTRVRRDPRPFVIALDGPAASGKSSVGLGAARQLGFGYFDTGLLYRALTWLALARRIDPGDARRLRELVDELKVELDTSGRVYVDGKDVIDELQTPPVDAAVSAVSAHASVREALRPVQRGLIRSPGSIMAGRDIGTVIFPDADLKIWLSASPEERARRRARQTGEPFDQVLEGMRRRDRLDASRAVAPMSAAADAIAINTDGIEPADVIRTIVALARQRGALSVRDPA